MSYPQQQYAPPQQAPQMPGFPSNPQQPQQYAQPQMPNFPPQQYGQQPPQQYAQPAPQLATGTLDDFYQQPSAGGGAALKFDVGVSYTGIVTRPITNADIQQQTQPGSGLPAFYKDGRPKFVLKVPLQLQPTPDRPDGLAQWYVSGGARDELVRAMAEAGAPAGPPEAGAVIQITCTGTRPAGPGMNPAKVYQVRYRCPDSSNQPAPTPAPVQPAAQQAPAPVQQAPAPAPVQPVQQTGPDPVVQSSVAELSPEQQQKLAALLGNTQ